MLEKVSGCGGGVERMAASASATTAGARAKLQFIISDEARTHAICAGRGVCGEGLPGLRLTPGGRVVFLAEGARGIQRQGRPLTRAAVQRHVPALILWRRKEKGEGASSGGGALAGDGAVVGA
ncbi:hypothetical protein E2562_011970 [Oryza meyeriana var. granulata]|uniref:Uncharacterized protein n=1 Tax=Oryza meyeriana var. granulata TaxID=110450 RepID=A0A6G1F782_9ORYZ|nr:hypothetical protein E2562_011970 [Oryza meyeriana var. granulata]